MQLDRDLERRAASKLLRRRFRFAPERGDPTYTYDLHLVFGVRVFVGRGEDNALHAVAKPLAGELYLQLGRDMCADVCGTLLADGRARIDVRTSEGCTSFDSGAVCAELLAIEGVDTHGAWARRRANRADLPYVELQESPLVAPLVQLRALVLGGRARCTPSSPCVSWLCETAPLWVLQAVARVIGWDEVEYT